MKIDLIMGLLFLFFYLNPLHSQNAIYIGNICVSKSTSANRNDEFEEKKNHIQNDNHK